MAKAYKKESDLILNIHEKNDLSTLDTVKVELKNPTEKIKFESIDDGGIRGWYNNTFYTWGFCTLKDSEKSSNPTRNVFYINKVVVQ
jgi:hypothetical protein